MFALRYDEHIFEKLKFGDWEKECIASSIQCKVADDEHHQKTQRPWKAFASLTGRASLKSETKLGFSEIGISLHKSKSKENYSIQFVCKYCRAATNILYPVAAARDQREEADLTMLSIFGQYFDLVGPTWARPTPAPPPPPPPPMPTRWEVDSAAEMLIQPEDEVLNQPKSDNLFRAKTKESPIQFLIPV